MVLYYFNISNLNIDEMKEYASLDCLEKLSTLYNEYVKCSASQN